MTDQRMDSTWITGELANAELIFQRHSKAIGDLLTRAREYPSSVPANTLASLLDAARADIQAHQLLHQQVLDNLPRHSTGSVRRALNKTAISRSHLLTAVIMALDCYQR